MAKDNSRPIFSCSFCSKTNLEVSKLINGNDVYICNECVELCHGILVEEKHTKPIAQSELTPERIKKFLDERIFIFGMDEKNGVGKPTGDEPGKRFSSEKFLGDEGFRGSNESHLLVELDRYP